MKSDRLSVFTVIIHVDVAYVTLSESGAVRNHLWRGFKGVRREDTLVEKRAAAAAASRKYKNAQGKRSRVEEIRGRM